MQLEIHAQFIISKATPFYFSHTYLPLTKPENFISLLTTEWLFFFAVFQKLLSAEERVSGDGRPPSGETWNSANLTELGILLLTWESGHWGGGDQACEEVWRGFIESEKSKVVPYVQSGLGWVARGSDSLWFPTEMPHLGVFYLEDAA